MVIGKTIWVHAGVIIKGVFVRFFLSLAYNSYTSICSILITFLMIESRLLSRYVKIQDPLNIQGMVSIGTDFFEKLQAWQTHI